MPSSESSNGHHADSSQPRNLRIAVLECDTPIGKTKEKYGGYGNLFEELLNNGTTRYAQQDHLPHRPNLHVDKFDVVENPAQKWPDLDPPSAADRYDAILLTGSKHDAFDDVLWIQNLVDYVRKVLALHAAGTAAPKLIGVCFGHQIVGRAMGAPVGRSDRGWEMAVTPFKLTERGSKLFGGREILNIHQMHRDVVFALPQDKFPPGLELVGSSDRCDVQGMYAPHCLISVQGHPEFNKDIVGELLQSRHERGIFTDEQFQDGMNRVNSGHDGTDIAAAFIRFAMTE